MSSTESATVSTKPVRIDTVEGLDVLMAKHDRVFLDIYTKGCTLCQSVEPVLGNASKATDVTIAIPNLQTDMSVVERYTIRSVPAFLLFEDGEPVDRLADGFRGVQAVVGFVEKEW